MSASQIEQAANAAAMKLGYRSGLKELQMKVVSNVVMKKDVFGILPTGYGKSLCYGCLPWTYDNLRPEPPDSESTSIVVVVSPLTAIIEDQVATWSKKGLKVFGITGSSTKECSVVESIMTGKYQLLFITPEAVLDNRRWRQMFRLDVYASRLKTFVIDEAHTVKMWGDTFRSTMLNLGEIRSLLPDNTSCLALTATATKSLRVQVATIMGMYHPLVVAVSPCKRNIMYSVSRYTTIQETFNPLLKRLCEVKTALNRVIVYCRRYEDCSTLYSYFKHALGKDFTEPRNAPDLSEFRLVEMFCSVTDECVKTQVIKSFTSKSPLRIVFATVAFGMGLDCPDVKQVIHLGAPNNIESYIQETGRCGRDGTPALATLLLINRNNQYREKAMLNYQKNESVCRRDMLFNDTDNYEHIDLGTKCMCCDVCASQCACGKCVKNHEQFIFL